MVDDLGSADLGCYGSEHLLTPNIDQLAANGIKLTQAYAGSTVCALSRSTLMTGLHAGHTQVRGNTGGIALPDAAFTMAEFFKQAGYVTGGFGKWGLGEIGTEGVPEKQGFDQFFGYYHQIHAHDYYPAYLWSSSEKISLPGTPGDAGSYSAYHIFDKMKNFIRSHQDQSFFCYAPWTLPHGQFVIPESDPAVAKYADKDWPQDYKNYAAMVSLIDQQVGETMQLLQELNLEKNTLVLFCSDNGGIPEFVAYQTNGPLRGGKRDLYEGGIRVPMILSWPDHIPAGSTFEESIYFPDLFPTLAEAAGLKVQLPNGLDGLSFYKNLLTPGSVLPDRYLYWEYLPYDWSTHEYQPQQLQQALRFGQWKAIRLGPEEFWALYDLYTDPTETDIVTLFHPAKMKQFEKWIKEAHVEPPPQTEPERVDGRAYR
ncbi:MAG: N-acetylgalactosamine-6-sulfatase [Saprospiraceae bacterium]|nr:MAG: N-acetylgalactosamine-6-sulfatase [Saprospiraceae bacterium]